MKRPTDQAKLLFFYLLRSSADALANNNAEGHICLRLARRTDVPSIQRCNLATLPENYNSQFYTNHLRQWPDLALVAEHVVPGQTTHHRAFPGAQPEPNIVGYVLGKVEDRVVPCTPNDDIQDDYSIKEMMDLAGRPSHRLEPVGHVTSLAVLKEYRRRGLAAALMDQLHAHLEQSHSVNRVSLHVRQGNAAATKLYQRYGYNVESVLNHYYADGEPAYLMCKNLQPSSVQNRLRITRPKPWQTKGPLQLPRIVWQPEEQGKDRDEATVMEEMEVMTGT